MHSVKIFGERNTGTNALAKIIERNSASRCLPAVAADVDPAAARRAYRRWNTAARRERIIDSVFAPRGPLDAWKHCATDFPDASLFANTLVLFTVRHPASWLVSLFRKPYHRLGPKVRSIEELMMTPAQTVDRERLGARSLLPLDLYQRKFDSYVELAARLTEHGVPHHFVRFEDLILRQEEVFRAIAPDLADAGKQFQELRKSTKDESKTLEDYQRYYGEELWRSRLCGLEDAVNSQIDWDRFRRFGYERLKADAAAPVSVQTPGGGSFRVPRYRSQAAVLRQSTAAGSRASLKR